jgi:hypothetical protein
LLLKKHAEVAVTKCIMPSNTSTRTLGCLQTKSGGSGCGCGDGAPFALAGGCHHSGQQRIREVINAQKRLGAADSTLRHGIGASQLPFE